MVHTKNVSLDFCIILIVISDHNVLFFVSAWILGWFMCKAVKLAEFRRRNLLFIFHFQGKTVPYIQGVSVAASVYSLIAVSLDR